MTVGEAWLQLMLALRLDAGDAERAAAGWDGGLYRAWTDGTHTAVVLRDGVGLDRRTRRSSSPASMEGWIERRASVRRREGAQVDVGFASDAAHLPRSGRPSTTPRQPYPRFRRLAAPKRSDLSGGMR